MNRKHQHYFRSVSHLAEVDVYRVLELFNVTDQALGHAIKKLVVPGMRGGGKTSRKDIEEAIDTLQRKLEMMDEDARVEVDQSADRGGVKTRTVNDGWVPWFGGNIPEYLDPNADVEYQRANGAAGRARVGALDWSWGSEPDPMYIVRYRLAPASPSHGR